MRKLLIIIIGLFILVSLFRGQPFHYCAPTVLPYVSTEMKIPGFWVSRLNEPDKVIMDLSQIQLFNQRMVKENMCTDIASFSKEYSGQELRASLKNEFKEISSAGYFLENGKRPAKKFFKSILKNINLENIPDQIQVRFAFVLRNTDQRILPVKEILTQKPRDIDFDELQNNALDMNTPVAVLTESKDRLWSYIVGPASSGWVLTENLAICSQDEMKVMPGNDFVVVTEAKSDVYLDKERSMFYGFARMGVRFEVKDFAQDIAEVVLPTRDSDGKIRIVSGYIRAKDLHLGYLPYTQRVIIEQAFELLNTPYGWGGANGEQDCSQFLQEIFSTTGIDLPRNSGSQAKAGALLYEFKKSDKASEREAEVIAYAKPGVSLLYMKGHIMLYLGEVNKKPFAIHDTRGYSKRIWFKDVGMLINKITVSDLTLGDGSFKGSWLSRLQCVRLIGAEK